MNLDRLVGDSSFYQEQRSQYLAVLDSELRDRISVLLSSFFIKLFPVEFCFALVELLQFCCV